MSNVDNIKHSLLSAPWLEYCRVTVPGADGPVELVIRRPPDDVIEELLEDAKAVDAGAEGDTKAKAGMAFRARVVARCTFLEDAVRPLFNEEEARRWPGLSLVFDACMAAINPAKALESARGN